MNTIIDVITPPCPVCRETTTLTLPGEAFLRWRAGELVQRVFPDWSPDERELLITGTHSDCWDRMLPEEDE